MIRVHPLEIGEVLRIVPEVFTDARGSFTELWQDREYAACGVGGPFVQDNASCSRQWTLRGLHYQVQRPQGKLVRVLRGEIFDVAVDLRRGSPTFGRSVSAHLSADNGAALWVPAGFAHGFLALAPDTLVYYKVTDYRSAGAERILAWNDPSLGIRWPIPAGIEPVMSERDRTGGSLLASADTYP